MLYPHTGQAAAVETVSRGRAGGGAIEVFCSRHSLLYPCHCHCRSGRGPVAANYLYGPRCMKLFFFSRPPSMRRHAAQVCILCCIYIPICTTYLAIGRVYSVLSHVGVLHVSDVGIWATPQALWLVAESAGTDGPWQWVEC